MINQTGQDILTISENTELIKDTEQNKENVEKLSEKNSLKVDIPRDLFCFCLARPTLALLD